VQTERFSKMENVYPSVNLMCVGWEYVRRMEKITSVSVMLDMYSLKEPVKIWTSVLGRILYVL
jgi:hypothetical protein